MSSQATMTQRSDYTFKYNRHLGRHGWLRLTPAYSVKLVEEILLKNKRDIHVLDPFSGTATTLLCAGYHNLQATGYELNPFLVWFGQTKTRYYSYKILQQAKETVNNIALALRHDSHLPPAPPPPIHNIKRWWKNDELQFLCKLQTCIETYSLKLSHERDILLVIFCRLIIQLSNAAFNHQSMSFKTEHSESCSLFEYTPDYIELFLKEGQQIIESAYDNPQKNATIIQGDARYLDQLKDEAYHLVITSPPYPNRMSYIRELRPYMYWLGYLMNGRDAGEIDWQAIGGTWGIATSRLNEWQRSSKGFYPTYFETLLADVASCDNKHGRLLANYLAKYFEDIWLHLSNIYRVMKPTGKAHYIVGNSIFYGITIPVELLYKDMLEALGFHNVSIKVIRKRNSKKLLYEYDITGEK